MPTTSRAQPNGNNLEPLTWQQTSLSTASQATTSRTAQPERSRSTKQSNKATKPNGKIGARPHLSGAVSDSAVLPATGSTLNWQQELFQSNANSTSFDQAIESPSVVSHKRQQSPTKSSSSANLNSNHSRKQQAKVDQTFGIANLDFNPPSAPSPRTQQPRNGSTTDRQAKSSKTSLKSPKPSRSSSNSLLPPSTPTPQSKSNSGTSTPRGSSAASAGGEARYAGPTFHNSPAPSSLPMPSFLLKRQQRNDLTAA